MPHAICMAGALQVKDVLPFIEEGKEECEGQETNFSLGFRHVASLLNKIPIGFMHLAPNCI